MNAATVTSLPPPSAERPRTRGDVAGDVRLRLEVDIVDALTARIRKAEGGERNALVAILAAFRLHLALAYSPTRWSARTMLAAETVVRKLGKRLDGDAIWWDSFMNSLDEGGVR